MDAGERLDSWKEIAAYLRRGARTVQRWEREEGLPVHRLQHEKLGSVYAYRRELDQWWRSRGADLESDPPAPHEHVSIAVLPFRDMSQDKDQEYFCEGLAEEMIGTLSRIEGLQVASRISSFRFKDPAADAGEVGRRLKVRSLLEGSVRESRGRLRITVRLTDTGSGFQRWTASYDRELSDIFSVQREIAENVARALEVTLTARTRRELGRTPTSNPEAYDCYLRGRKFFYGYGARDMDFAIQLFNRAIAHDPGFAPAYAGLADCWSYLYLYATRSDILREQAEWASARAVELNPRSAQAHASRAVALSLMGKDEEAEEAFATAARLDPNLFEAHYFHARHAFVRGQIEKAAEYYERAMRVRPEDFQSPLLVAQIYDRLGRGAGARAARQRGIELAEQHLQLNPDDARAVYMAANGMAALGQRDLAREWTERAVAMRPDDSMVLYNAGCIYSLLGCAGEALACLERAAAGGLTQKGWYEHDSDLDPLRGEARFQALLERLA